MTELVTVRDETTVLVREVEPPTVVEVAGAQGPEGVPGNLIHRVAATALSGHRVVLAVDDVTAGYASPASLSQTLRVLGVTTHAAEAGADVTIQVSGVLTEPSWSWVAGQPVFLGLNGVLTQVVPSAPALLLVVGVALTATSLKVAVQPPISLS